MYTPMGMKCKLVWTETRNLNNQDSFIANCSYFSPHTGNLIKVQGDKLFALSVSVWYKTIFRFEFKNLLKLFTEIDIKRE